MTHFFIKNNQRIPFSQFLQDEKNTRGYSWKEMDRICGVDRINSYVMSQTKGHPNNSPYSKALKIIRSLGYSEDDFEFDIKILEKQRTPELSVEIYKEKLWLLGDGILKITSDNIERGTNPQKLSVSIIKEFCGETFYRKYAVGLLKKQKVHQDLLELDSRFSSIEIQHQAQVRKPILNLELFEKESIETILMSYIEQTPQNLSDRLPRGMIKSALDELNVLRQDRGLPDRTYPSTWWQIHKMWTNEKKKYTHERGSPIGSKGIIDQIFTERIEDITEKQDFSPEIENITKILMEEDKENRRRDLYRTYSQMGHTNLVLFLMDPDNYSEYISKDVTLFAIDFGEDDIDEDLKEEFKKKIVSLKARQKESSDEADVIDFVDHWLRCDMIFMRNGGGFVVVEVKQFAFDRVNGYKNATKACQQLSAYTAVILDNILRHNIDSINTPEYKPMKESVEGYLVAYEMARFVENHLNRTGNKRPVKIPKYIVDNYITELHKSKILNIYDGMIPIS